VIVFCADSIISGNVDTYELEGLKTVSDAAYIRRLSRNVARGYDQKWRMFADPGGHPPLGFARVGERQLLAPVEGPDLDRVRRAFELYASGAWSDTNLADELGMAEAGMTEILTNPLYAGRAIRHKGRPDQEEQPTRFAAPIDPALFERVASIRVGRRTAYSVGARSQARRSYPLVPFMHCLDCGSGYHGDANNGLRRIRHSRRPACSRFATYRADRYEEQLAARFDGLRFEEADVEQVLAAMRQTQKPAPAPDPDELAAARADLQARLAAGSISIEAFSREWRRLDRPVSVQATAPDEVRLRKARKVLAEFGTLWRDPQVPDRLREEALHEILAGLDVRGPEIVAIHPAPNENAWLLGQAALREESLLAQQHVGMVGARGLAPSKLSDRFASSWLTRRGTLTKWGSAAHDRRSQLSCARHRPGPSRPALSRSS
jgi:hypothetical protein